MFYTNGDGLWLRCSCMRSPKLLCGFPVTVTMVEMIKLVRLHEHH